MYRSTVQTKTILLFKPRLFQLTISFLYNRRWKPNSFPNSTICNNPQSSKQTNKKKKKKKKERKKMQETNQSISREEMANSKTISILKEESSVPPIDPMMEEEEDDDSDFSFVISSSDRFNDKFPNITADELFSHGKILPLYPVFGNSRSFKKEENIEVSGRGASVSEPELSGEFCDWVPKSAPASPERCRKSRSTGSTRKWLFHDFLLGGRSHSDGKQKFIFLNKDGENKKKGNEITEVKEKDMAKMYKAFYGNKAEKKNEKEKGKRKSYLPYVGFFGGGLNSNGRFTRSSYPF